MAVATVRRAIWGFVYWATLLCEYGRIGVGGFVSARIVFASICIQALLVFRALSAGHFTFTVNQFLLLKLAIQLLSCLPSVWANIDYVCYKELQRMFLSRRSRLALLQLGRAHVLWGASPGLTVQGDAQLVFLKVTTGVVSIIG
jgi:hypothetical protein